ncbi:ATP-binding protein [Stenotrophomonas indicatrix]|uniref:ATP-binding protein n=1 Tax=Stenotrophomonas indicatrix TaxID=2045451 RepID=UPI0013DB3C73|nr:ATP-binding protein [Stenotrophomonas indicatrix]
MNDLLPGHIWVEPSAARLLESMRDIGYSFESALADIVDNSISAGARMVEIFNDIHADGSPFLAILDDGRGMRSSELTAAMQHGSRSPRDVRAATDLGRFGLGLKTASFSQCRRLTVASRVDGDLAARSWDLDLVLKKDQWLLKVLEPEEIEAIPMINLLPSTGTLVVWQGLDRLDPFENSSDDALVALNDLFANARSHLALTFHRFLAQQKEGAVSLRLNGSPVLAADPFAQHISPSSDAHEAEIIRMAGSTVTVQAFTLPHHQHLSPEQMSAIELGSSLTETQGLYVYRAGRLIAGGTWLGLVRKSELTKLLRVQVDVPTSLDSEWSIDVRKSRMRLPSVVRRRLRPLIERMTETARRPYTYRGRRQAAGSGLPLWQRVEERGAVRYEVRRDHPIIEALRQAAGSRGDVDTALLAIEATLPLESVFSDIASSPKAISQQVLSDAELAQLLATYVEAIVPGKNTLPRSIAEVILATPVFAGQRDARRALGLLRIIED